MKPASGEVIHMVLFKWKEGTASEAAQKAMEGLRGLENKIPGILELSCGENFSDRSQGFQCALLVRFENRAALDVYGPHPAHQEVVQTLIVPIRSDVIVADYEI